MLLAHCWGWGRPDQPASILWWIQISERWNEGANNSAAGGQSLTWVLALNSGIRGIKRKAPWLPLILVQWLLNVKFPCMFWTVNISSYLFPIESSSYTSMDLGENKARHVAPEGFRGRPGCCLPSEVGTCFPPLCLNNQTNIYSMTESWIGQEVVVTFDFLPLHCRQSRLYSYFRMTCVCIADHNVGK